MSDDLAAWLLERIAVDELVAGGNSVTLWPGDTLRGLMNYDEAKYAVQSHDVSPQRRAHIMRFDPRRMLAECDVKRRIIELHTVDPGDPYIDCPTCVDSDQRDLRSELAPGEPLPTCDTLRLFALPYADRPGYREEWRP
jgi:hypothetical protein